MRSSLVEIALLALCGCGDRRIDLIPPWPAEQVAVVVVLDETGAVVWGPEIARAGRALKLVLDTGESSRLVAKTFAPGVPDFEECGVEIGGAGGRAPEAIRSWSSATIDGKTGSIVMVEEDVPTALDLRLPACKDDPSEMCERVLVQQIPIELTGNFTDVAMSTNDTAFAVLKSDTTDESHLLRWDQERSEITVVDVGGSPVSVGSAKRSIVWVGLRGGGVVVIDEPGDISSPIETGFLEPRVEVGNDRHAIVHDGTTALEIPFASSSTGARDDLPAPIESLFVSGAERMLLVTRGAIRVFDGAWSEELREDQLGAEWFAYGDATFLGVIGFLDLYQRDEAARTWAPIGSPPTASFQAYGATYLGNGISLTVGDAGYAGLVVNGATCKIETGTTRKLRAVDAFPTALIGVMVGENEDAGSEPFMAMIDLSRLL